MSARTISSWWGAAGARCGRPGRLGSTRLVGAVGGKLFTPPADNIELPDYTTP